MSFTLHVLRHISLCLFIFSNSPQEILDRLYRLIRLAPVLWLNQEKFSLTTKIKGQRSLLEMDKQGLDRDPGLFFV